MMETMLENVITLQSKVKAYKKWCQFFGPPCKWCGREKDVSCMRKIHKLDQLSFQIYSQIHTATFYGPQIPGIMLVQVQVTDLKSCINW